MDIKVSENECCSILTKITFGDWNCTRSAGHDGPCAAVPINEAAIYQMALVKYGHVAQAQQSMEELGELMVAISKCFFRGKGVEGSGIVSELADVSIMVDQLIHILDVRDDFVAERKFKLDRLVTRLQD
jgi:hypothetical protein